jgi:hypothetical protein
VRCARLPRGVGYRPIAPRLTLDLEEQAREGHGPTELSARVLAWSKSSYYRLDQHRRQAFKYVQSRAVTS